MDWNIPENSTLEYSYGLDLGTHRSLMAVKAKDSRPEAIIPNNQDCRKGIPSLFWRKADSEGGGELLCEQVLAEQGEINDPEGVVRSVKTLLASETEEDKKGNETILLHGHRYTPVDIIGKEVSHVYALSMDAAEEMGIYDPPRSLTVGVPVRFGAVTRTTIRNVLNHVLPGITIRLLPEPMAAALYYAASSRQKTRYTLAFDMGAGTFDTCVLEAVENRNPYPYRVLTHDGSRDAGDRLDEQMEALILEKLRQNPGSINLQSFSPGSHDLRALRKTAQMAKESLSSAPRCTVNVTSLANCSTQTVTVFREEYEARIEPIVRRAVDMAVDCLKGANLWGQQDLTVLMVGGSSYIPLVQRLLRERFPWLDSKSQVIQRNPDQAVALGCALYAEQPTMAERKVAYAYAVVVYQGKNNNRCLDVRIPSSCKLPYSIQGRYATKDPDQKGLSFRIYEVENGKEGDLLPPEQGRKTQLIARHYFGKTVPQGTPVLLTTELNEDGILTLIVDDGGISSQQITRHTFDLTRSVGEE